MKIFPSLLAADPLRLAEAIKLVESHCDGFHLDIMDDHFVSNIAGGVDLVTAVQKVTQKPITIHLMVERPEKWLDRLSLRPQDCVVFHWESVAGELAKTVIESARAKHWCVGLAVRPKTPVTELGVLLPLLNLVMVMSVEPGRAGQLFIESSVQKLSEIIALRKKTNSTFQLMVDGGVDQRHIAQLTKLGVDIVAVGAAVFGAKNPVAALKMLKTP